MTGRKKITTICCLLLIGLLGLCSCSSPSSNSAENSQLGANDNSTVLEQNELVYESSMEIKYADNFSVDYYVGGYKLLKVKDGTKLLVVPEGKTVPKGLEDDVYVMQQPIQNLYLVATAVMDMFDSLDAVDTIRLSGQKEGNWYIESANEAMAKGDMLYAGKYNKPDYELIIQNVDVVQMQVSRAKNIGIYHLMQSENPVWICAFDFLC